MPKAKYQEELVTRVEKEMKKTARIINAAYDALDKSAKKIKPDVLNRILKETEKKIIELKEYLEVVRNNENKSKIKAAEKQIKELSELYVAAYVKDMKKRNNYIADRNAILDAVDRDGKTKNLVSALDKNELHLAHLKQRSASLESKGINPSEFKKQIAIFEKNREKLIKRLEKKDNDESKAALRALESTPDKKQSFVEQVTKNAELSQKEKFAIVKQKFEALFPQGGVEVRFNAKATNPRDELIISFSNDAVYSAYERNLSGLAHNEELRKMPHTIDNLFNYLTDNDKYTALAKQVSKDYRQTANMIISNTERDLLKKQSEYGVELSDELKDNLKSIYKIRDNPASTTDDIYKASKELRDICNNHIIPAMRIMDIENFRKNLIKNYPLIAEKHSEDFENIKLSILHADASYQLYNAESKFNSLKEEIQTEIASSILNVLGNLPNDDDDDDDDEDELEEIINPSWDSKITQDPPVALKEAAKKVTPEDIQKAIEKRSEGDTPSHLRQQQSEPASPETIRKVREKAAEETQARHPETPKKV